MHFNFEKFTEPTIEMEMFFYLHTGTIVSVYALGVALLRIFK